MTLKLKLCGPKCPDCHQGVTNWRTKKDGTRDRRFLCPIFPMEFCDRCENGYLPVTPLEVIEDAEATDVS